MKLGIDIGGTNITLGLVRNDKLIFSSHVPSFDKKWDKKETLSYLEKEIDRMISPEVSGIGIGVPSVVDTKKGIVYDTANIPSWEEVHLKEHLEKKYGIEVNVNNDSNCYALGSYISYPAQKRPESLAAITLGTGVGMGIVIDGKLFCGKHCGAGELSCIPYKGKTLEEFCCKGFFLNAGTTPKEAYEKASAGCGEAAALFREYGTNLGIAVCAALFAYDPERIVLGGGIAKGFSMFRTSMEEYIRNNFPYRKTVQDLTIDIMTDDCIPVLGAASL